MLCMKQVDQYRVIHVPLTQYRVIHVPIIQYRVIHVPLTQYRVIRVPLIQYRMIHVPITSTDFVTWISCSNFLAGHPSQGTINCSPQEDDEVIHRPTMLLKSIPTLLAKTCIKHLFAHIVFSFCKKKVQVWIECSLGCRYLSKSLGHQLFKKINVLRHPSVMISNCISNTDRGKGRGTCSQPAL